MKLEFNLETFYNIGMLCFFIIAVSGIYTLINNWATMDLGMRVAKIFNIIFNFALVKLFSFLKSTIIQQKKTQEITEEEMLKLADKLKP